MSDDNQKKYVVLIVDDDHTMRLLMREALEQDGFIVEEAKDGSEVVQMFEQVRPALILMDVQMPDMDGFTACSLLREHKEGADVPVMMITGLDDVESITKAYEVGATDFLAKPINWLLLSHRVRYILRASLTYKSLKASEEKLAEAQRMAHIGSWEWDIDNDRLQWSQEVFKIFGLTSSMFEATYNGYMKSVHPRDKEMVIGVVNDALTEKKPLSVDHQIIRPDRQERVVHVQGEPGFNNKGEITRLFGTVQDITERKKAEEKIRHLAFYDSLTDLPNRRLFEEHLAMALRNAKRYNGFIGLLHLNLDRFKRINETMGYTLGDSLLKLVAANINNGIRNSDLLSSCSVQKKKIFASLSRIGGDEFLIMLTNLEDIKWSATVAERIMENLSQPFLVDNQEIFVSASIGISVYPQDGNQVDTLLKNANIALNHAKNEGGGQFQFFNHSMNTMALNKLKIEGDLSKALERNELILYYQPQLDLETGRIMGIEALLRWQHPDEGLLPPDKFIPIAEETGLIVAIGEWVIKTACMQNKKWHEAGFTDLTVAVNVSSRQFRQKNLSQIIENILESTGLAPQYLDVELTESSIMSEVEESTAVLYKLQGLGVKLSVDDFGTGYSSLSYLKRFPLNMVKIDRSFVIDLTRDPSDAAIVKAIIVLAESMGLEVIAEGVETEQQLDFLRGQGCPKVQGYLISRPIPAGEIEALLKQTWPY